MKKFLALFAVLLVAIMVFACGNTETTTTATTATTGTTASQTTETSATTATTATTQTTATSATTQTTATSATPAVTSGVVVDLDFGSITDGVIKDKSENGNDAKLTGNATVADGKITFAEDGAYLTIKDNAMLNWTTADSFSMSLTFQAADKTPAATNWPCLIQKGGSKNGWWGIWFNGGKFVWGGLKTTQNNPVIGTADTAEHTVVVIQDAENNKLYVYVDNVKVLEHTAMNYSSNLDLWIGGNVGNKVQQFYGSISEFKVWNYAVEAPKAPVVLPDAYVDVDFGTTVTDANGKATFQNIGTPVVGDVEVKHNGVTKTVKALKISEAGNFVVGTLTEMDTEAKMNAMLAAGFSIEAFYLDNSSVAAAVFCMTESSRGFGIAHQKNNKDAQNNKPYFVTGNGSGYNTAYPAATISDTELVHVVAVYDATAKTFTVYVNGEASGTPTANIPAVVATQTTSKDSIKMFNAFGLGGDLSPKTDRKGDFLADDMVIVDAKLYTKALTAADVTNLYNAAKAPFVAAE